MPETQALAGHTSTAASTKTLQDAGRKVAGKIADETEALASGMKSGGYSGKEVAEMTRRILSTEQHTLEGKATQSKITLLTGRIALADSANKSLRDITTKFHVRVAAAQGVDSDAQFPKFCADLLKQVEQTLNKKLNGHSLFGASANQKDAVDLSNATTPTPGQQPTAAYNQYANNKDPDNQTHKTTVGDEEFEYGAGALDEGVRDLIFYLKSGMATTPDGDRDSDSGIRLQGMQDGLTKVTTSLTNTQKEIGAQMGSLERIQKNVTEELAYNEETMAELTHADLYAQLIKHHEDMLQQQMLMTIQRSKTDDFQKLMQQI